MAPSEEEAAEPDAVEQEALKMEAEFAAEEAGEARPAKKKKPKKAAQRSSSGETQTYENGVLRKLELQNFMNHTHLAIDFDPHVNFIVGKNGSGKSAIVNALIAGFGHKASATGRNTNSTKHLIKHGAESALISIHLANGGDDAYKADEFGDTIICERRIERSSTGTYKLRDGPDGVARKSSHSEFMELCQHFNIQANNPCALLTQEHAKKFLHNGNEEDRYRFFLQAANLETRKLDLGDTRQNVAHLREKLSRAQQQMEEKQELADQAQREYEGAQKLRDIQKQLDEFEPLLGWALVGEKEVELEEAERRQVEAAAKEEDAKQATIHADDSRKEHELRLASAEEAKSKADRELDHFSSQAEKHHHLADRVLQEKKKAKKAAAEMRNLLEDAREDAASAKEEVEKAVAALDGTKDKAAMAHANKLQSVTEGLAQAEQLSKKLKDEVEEIKATYERTVDEWRAAKQDLERTQSELKAKEGELQALRKGAFDRVRQLHPSMGNLLKAIEKSKAQFESPPVGPIGLHVAVKPEFEHLGPSVESALGEKQMLSWIVHSAHDERLLRQLLRAKEVGRELEQKTVVHINKVEPRFRLPPRGDGGAGNEADGEAGVPSSKRSRRSSASDAAGTSADTAAAAAAASDGAPTLVEALTFTSKTTAQESDAIFNHLCNGANAAIRYLFNNRAEAERATFSSSLARVEGVICEKSGQDGRKFFRRGNTTASERILPVRHMLARDKQSAISQLVGEVQAARQSATALEQTYGEVDGRRKTLIEQEKSTRKKQKTEEARVEDLDRQLGELQSEGSDSSVMLEIQNLQEQMRKATNLAVQYETELERLAAKEAEANEKFQPLKEQNEANKAKYDALAAKVSELSDAVEAARAPITKSKARTSSMRKQLTEAQRDREEAAAKCAELQTYLENTMPMVEELYGERVRDPKKRTAEQLKKEKAVLEAKQKREQARQGGRALSELAERATAAMQQAQKRREEMATVSSMGDKQEQMLTQRVKHFTKHVKGLGRQASANFNQCLSRKNHAGELHFDHLAEALSLQVQRNSQDTESAATQDARGLSGGERSFTTLAFELAMWEFCATPFRVLDEFDVFMDDTYRKQAVETLMELCDSQPGRQFLFITPQDMHPFLTSRLADETQTVPTITKMKDPRPKASS